MSIFTAPFYALFSVPFYRQVIQSKVWRGVQYVLFLSVISTLLLAFQFTKRALPVADEFVGWLKGQMPVVTLTQEGLQVNRETPYTIVHPEMGPLAVFDLTRPELGANDINESFIYVTSEKIYLQQAPGDIRVYTIQDIIEKNRAKLAQGPLLMSGETLESFYRGAKPWFTALMIVVVLFFEVVAFLLGGLLLSVLGLLINMGRDPSLDFKAIFVASLFAMSASTLLVWAGILVPAIGQIPLGFLIGSALNIVYLFVAIRLTAETR